jgi:tetratricopeptide (TPR) repeat protein
MDKDMQKGYGYDYEGETGKAIFYWHVVFENLKSYFEEYKLESLEEFDKIFKGNQFVSNWVSDYDDALRKVLLNTDKISKQEIGGRKIDLLNFLLSLNLSEETTIHNHKRSLAETYYLMGQPEVGEKHFIQLIEEYPDNAWGYIGYSDQYWLEKDYKNYEKALKILNEAYNRGTVNESDDIVERLTGLHIAIKKKELEEYLKKKKPDEKRPIVPEYSTLYQELLEKRKRITTKSDRKNIYKNNGQTIVKGRKIGRNEPCPCGSGKKYKKCCGK